MSIAFYAPLKSPEHPVPSGDRQMGRLLMLALQRAGLSPALASNFRAYLPKGDYDLVDIKAKAQLEVEALLKAYASGDLEKPQLWFTYHPYYKSPDLLGPKIAQALHVPYVTAEASHAPKRASGPWAAAHAHNESTLLAADLSFYFTEQDKAGLLGLLNDPGKLVSLPPFIDVADLKPQTKRPHRDGAPVRLLTVAMMRQDVKLASYQMLAAALKDLQHLDWTLDIVGDGDARSDVESAFAPVNSARLRWHGRLEAPELTQIYGQADLYVWPGFGEAYGMAFLEAQACGVAVVAQDTRGIPSVVDHDRTGLLTPENDVLAFREAVRSLIENRERLADLGAAASQFVHQERSVERASAILKTALDGLL